jgi:hypothetical protein
MLSLHVCLHRLLPAPSIGRYHGALASPARTRSIRAMPCLTAWSLKPPTCLNLSPRASPTTLMRHWSLPQCRPCARAPISPDTLFCPWASAPIKGLSVPLVQPHRHPFLSPVSVTVPSPVLTTMVNASHSPSTPEHKSYITTVPQGSLQTRWTRSFFTGAPPHRC